MIYNKSQTGWIMIIVFTLIIAQISYSFFRSESPIPLQVYLGLMALMLGVLLNFYQLNVRVDRETIRLSFGIGLLRFTFRPKQITEVNVIKTPWYYGIGIRFTPKGMLYNVHGFNAVQITYTDEKSNGSRKTMMVGSADAQQLCSFLRDQSSPSA